MKISFFVILWFPLLIPFCFADTLKSTENLLMYRSGSAGLPYTELAPESTYPSKSAIRYQKPSLWTEHRGLINTALAFFLVLAGLVALLFVKNMKTRRAHAELQKTKANLVALINNTGDMICSRDRESALIIWNNAFSAVCRNFFGIDAHIGMRTLDHVPTDQRKQFDRLAEPFGRVFAGERIRDEFPYTWPNGETHFYELMWSPIRSGDEVIAVAEVTRDITDRKKTEIQMRISNERFLAFLKNSTEAIWCFEMEQPIAIDLSEDEQVDLLYRHAFVKEANDMWAQRIGFEHGEDLLGLRLEDIIPRATPESIASLKKIIQAHYSIVDVETVEFTKKNEKQIYLNNIIGIIENRHLLRAWGTSRNITELKTSELQLRETESRYRTVADFTYDWEYWEGHNGELKYLSPSCERITGYTREEFLKYPQLLKDIIVPEDQQVWTKHRHEAFRRYGLQEIQFRILKKDGTLRWIEHACQQVKDEDGSFLGFRASNRDITDRKHAQEESQRLRMELLHATRVSAMGELTAALAHELNQPLAAILSNAQAAQRFLKRKKPDLNEVRDILSDIVSDDNRAKEVILKLRSLLKKSNVQLQKLDINRIIQEVIPLVQSESLIRNITLRMHLEEDIPAVMGDKVQLQQVMINLILNGFEAMINTEPKEMHIKTTQNDPDTITVSVKDWGHGVDEENIEDLFRPFITKKKEGMGIGLAITKSIVEFHGGKMCVKNNSEKGATFYFSLPACPNR
jgi:PAS domain S-box-containing protein